VEFDGSNHSDDDDEMELEYFMSTINFFVWQSRWYVDSGIDDRRILS
jgi:hypothetical protein